jgi:hypothetical protein
VGRLRRPNRPETGKKSKLLNAECWIGWKLISPINVNPQVFKKGDREITVHVCGNASGRRSQWLIRTEGDVLDDFYMFVIWRGRSAAYTILTKEELKGELFKEGMRKADGNLAMRCLKGVYNVPWQVVIDKGEWWSPDGSRIDIEKFLNRKI